MTTIAFNLNVKHLISKVTCIDEQEILIKLIYHKGRYHSIKCIPFQDDWSISWDLEVVKSALIKLSSIRFALDYWKKSLHTPEALRVLMYVDKVYHDLLKFLIFEGSKNVPFIIKNRYLTIGCISKEQALIISHEIVESVLKPYL